jgi:hypothetical protein
LVYAAASGVIVLGLTLSSVVKLTKKRVEKSSYEPLGRGPNGESAGT